jgi:hypothetical protein
MLRLGLALGVLSLLPLRAAATPPAGQWVVVVAPAFQKAVEPLCAWRRAQGLRVVVIRSTDVLTAAEVRSGAAGRLRDHVRKVCRAHAGPNWVLLMGAIEAGTPAEAEQKVVPTLPGSAGRMKGQPSDNGYGCLDGSRLPSVPVGRLPARSEAEARALVAKVLAFEREGPGPWRRRLTVLAGIPAFNAVVDRWVEREALTRFARIDPSWSGRVLYTGPSSCYNLPARLIQARARQYVEAGQAFTLYLGHSDASGLHAGAAPFLDRTDWARLKIARGAGVLVTFGCNGCQLKGPDGEGYGVAAVRNPHGPVAVIGSHGVCFAAMGQLAGVAAFASAFSGRVPERLGEVWLALLKGVARGPIDPFTYATLNWVDGNLRISQATQRQEHLEMFLLLGDPALRLPQLPQDVELRAPDAAPGRALMVGGTLPARLAGARVRLTLERPVGSEPDGLERLPRAEPARERVQLANHERANRFALAEAEVVARGGSFTATLAVPARLPWPRLVLRAYAATERADGQGVRRLAVRRD